MSLSPFPVESFGGLNLSDDPGQIGWDSAIDVLNIEFDQRGRVRTRPGYTLLATGSTWQRVYTWRTSDADNVIAIRDGTHVDAINVSTGVTTATKTWASANYTDLNVQPYGIPAAPATQNFSLYVAGGLQPMQKWTGAAFSDVATAPRSTLVGLLPAENRLVAANIFDSATTVQDIDKIQFSDAGDPTTWGANNYLRLRPGVSGQGAAQPYNGITALINWRELLFVFKRDAVFVFYGSSTDSSGNPIFNYRALDYNAIGCNSYMGVAASPRGVYFIGSDGIYLTSGETPTKVSAALDPIFRGQGADLSYFTPASSFTPGARSVREGLFWWHDRLFYTRWADASQTIRVTFVLDDSTGAWSYWDLPILGSPASVFGTSVDLDQNYILAALNSGGIAKIDWTTRAATDNGTAITSRYRSGFSDLGSPDMKVIREWRLQGSGSPTFSTSTDFGALETGATVTLGTSPATAEGRRRYAVRGRQFSFQIGGTSAWSLNNLVANIREKRLPGTHNT